MVRLVCPRCAAKFQPHGSETARCSSCGYEADVPATAPYGNAPPMPAPVASMGVADPSMSWPARRNGLAVASMAMGIISALGLAGLVAAFGARAHELAGLSVAGALLAPMGFILGLVANHQIRRDRSRGLGMAVTGITMGCSVTVAVLFVLATI